MSEPKSQLPRRVKGRLLDLLFTANLFVAELVMVAMMGLIIVEVFLRSTFRISLQFADEVSAYMLVAVTFLGFSAAMRGGTMFRVEFLFRLIPARARLVVELLFNTASFAFTLVLTYYLVMLTISSYQRDVLSQSLLRTPQFVPQMIMPIGMALLAIALLVLIVGNLAELIYGRREEAGE